MRDIPPLRAPDFAPFQQALSDLALERVTELDQLLRRAAIPDVQRLMERGVLSAAELTRYYLARIRRYDGRLHSVVELNPEALELAAALDTERRAGRVRGPLHGIPLLLKDNIATGDRMHTTAGAAALLEAHADRDAFVAARLRAAGAVLLGKTNLSEWANFMSNRSSNGFSAVGGQTRNPRGRFDVGGSSSGSGAAVAARLAVAAIGSETYGSIISPAGRCGLVGHKPTHGLVSRDRIIPITDATDTAGPLASNALDAAILLHAIAGADPNDPATLGTAAHSGIALTPDFGTDALRGRLVGVVPGARRIDDGRIVRAALAALRAAGAVLVEITFAPPEVDFGPIMRHGFKHGVNAYLAATEAPVGSLAEVIAFNRRDMRRYAPRGQALLEAAEKDALTRDQYGELVRREREKSLAAVRGALQRQRLDFLLSFGTFAAYNMAGVPLLSMPAGALPSGEPYPLLLAADLGRDGELLAAGAALERTLREGSRGGKDLP
jgi:amidase